MIGDIAGARVLGTQEITFEDVLRAGRVLFGPAFTSQAIGWQDALRTTYRRRAMETHPDRARALGRSERELSREFERVADAYRVLSALRAGRVPVAAVRPAAPRAPARPAERAREPWPPPAAERSRGARARADAAAARPPVEPRGEGGRVRVSVRPQDLPRRRLRFAEYLYYSGRARWSELVEAIAWQRAQRPPLGRIAVQLGFIGPDDVGVILERRREAGAHATPFGEWAVRLGYLSSFQLLAVLGQQLRLQQPIGRFFVERGILEHGEIDAVHRGIFRHNAQFHSGGGTPQPCVSPGAVSSGAARKGAATAR
jgi:hypothetical protein